MENRHTMNVSELKFLKSFFPLCMYSKVTGGALWKSWRWSRGIDQFMYLFLYVLGNGGGNEGVSEIIFPLSQPLSVFALVLYFYSFDLQKDEAVHENSQIYWLLTRKSHKVAVFHNFELQRKDKPCHEVDLRRWKY